MEIIHGIYSLKPEHKGCVLTVGNFDGVHHGHRLLLIRSCSKVRVPACTAVSVVATAALEDCMSTVMTMPTSTRSRRAPTELPT